MPHVDDPDYPDQVASLGEPRNLHSDANEGDDACALLGEQPATGPQFVEKSEALGVLDRSDLALLKPDTHFLQVNGKLPRVRMIHDPQIVMRIS